LVLAIGISTVLYLLHLVVRLAVSSLHLSRDACERQNLTHVFLALLKEGKIELKEREIVYSALFSRSDSGLLKHDGGPSMAGPSGWLSDLFKGGR